MPNKTEEYLALAQRPDATAPMPPPAPTTMFGTTE